jgi:hypothetical protein
VFFIFGTFCATLAVMSLAVIQCLLHFHQARRIPESSKEEKGTTSRPSLSVTKSGDVQQRSRTRSCDSALVERAVLALGGCREGQTLDTI